jgi:hypothetical protein
MAQPDKSADAAAAARAVEALKLRCTDALERIRAQAAAGDAASVEAGVKALHDAMREPTLPRDFVDHVRTELKSLDLMVNMKATDMALRRAVAHAQADRKLERNQEVAAARRFLSRAIALGAHDEFKHAAEMTIESAMLTGGVKHIGPTRAKPGEEAPPPRALAKGERREFKRYPSPLLTVTVGEQSFQTIDWSMGGMLVVGSTADQFPSGEPVQVELAAPGGDHPIRVSVVAVRVDIPRGGIAVRFFQVTAELSNLLRRVILHRG